MNNNEAVQLYVQLDTKDAQMSVQQLLVTLDAMNTSLQTVTQWDMSYLVNSLNLLTESFSTLSLQLTQLLGEGSLLTTFTEIGSVFSLLFEIGMTLVGSGILENIASAVIELDKLSPGSTAPLSPLALLIQTCSKSLQVSLIPLLDRVFEGITTAFGPASTSSILSMVAIIGLVVSEVAILIRNFDSIKSALTLMWQDTIQPLGTRISQVVESIGESLATIWNETMKPLFEWILKILEPFVLGFVQNSISAVRNILKVVSDVVGAILIFLDGFLQFFAGVFSEDLGDAIEGLVKMFGGFVELFGGIINGIINCVIYWVNEFFNSIYAIFASVCNGLNAIIKPIGKALGKSWDISVPATRTQIPYLAKGAVLPANKPFLAMVGDQKHGTNIEAPLATIQDAVALVMNDQAAAMMAGFEAVVRAINEKNATLELDGREIWAAYNAYNRKAAVVRGHVGFRKLWSKDRSRVS